MTKRTLLKHVLVSTAGLVAFSFISLSPVLAYAAQPAVQTTSVQTIEVAAEATPEATAHVQNFTRKKYNITGDYRIVQEGGRTLIRFSGDFKTKRGPDLKVFLSPQSIDDVTGRTAVDGAVKLGALKSNTGTQDYVLPAGVSLVDFSSVLIHCEAFSVLWGGGEI